MIDPWPCRCICGTAARDHSQVPPTWVRNTASQSAGSVVTTVPPQDQLAAVIVGIARKNENSAAAGRSSPSIMPPTMVAPDRDTPGISASAWQTLWSLIVPLSKPGIVIGSIFVVTIVMGDFITFGVMGGEQIASAGKVAV